MAKFEFDSQKLELEICGSKYTVNVDNNTSKLCSNIQKEAKELFEKVSKDEASVTEDEICKFFLVNIDKLLGKGSTTAIFMGRKKNFVDASQLFNFIIRELNMAIRKNIDVLGG